MLRGETLVFTGLTARMVVQGVEYTTARSGADHQPAPNYIKYKPRWINTFTAGKNFGVTTVTYQPFDQVKVEGYPHSWATWICFDTTLTDLPVGPYPHQRTKATKQGDVKAVRIVEGTQCVEPDASRFRAGAGKHLIGGRQVKQQLRNGIPAEEDHWISVCRG